VDHSNNVLKIFNEAAGQYQCRFMNVSAYSKSLNRFCDLLPFQNAKILDAACGPGNISSYLKNHLLRAQIVGIDFAPKMIARAQNNVPSGEFKQMDLRHISQINDVFDGIICGFGLPYLSNNEAFDLMKDAHNLLSEKGILYLSTMEGNYTNSRRIKSSTGQGEGLFTYFHDAAFLEKSLTECGFSTPFIERVYTSNSDGSVIKDIILIAPKGIHIS
jgi:ubiquinone/menaquinone biosynthesis C-methylase UbiE